MKADITLDIKTFKKTREKERFAFYLTTEFTVYWTKCSGACIYVENKCVIAIPKKDNNHKDDRSWSQKQKSLVQKYTASTSDCINASSKQF